jgi:plasmid maintenance system antidote protein VapI
MAMPEAPGNMQHLMMDAAVDMSLHMTAQMFGIPREAVSQIVQAGLPVMARMAQRNPDLFSKMYAQSVEMLPEPMQAFYDTLAADPAAQARLAHEFTAMYGPMTDAINREAAIQAGTSEAEAGKVLATTMPALSQAMARATDGDGEAGMMSWLKGLSKR